MRGGSGGDVRSFYAFLKENALHVGNVRLITNMKHIKIPCCASGASV